MIQFNGDFVRNNHSISLVSHNIEYPEMDRAKSANVIIHRRPAYPAHVPDLSMELLEETSHRQTIISQVLENDPKAFRR